MKIIVAETAGFCWGVQRAIDISLDLSKSTGEPVYTYGPLIHNNQVVDELRKRNITNLEKSVEEARDGSLVVRAHGLRPDVMDEVRAKHDHVIDATCPLVNKVHRKIARRQAEGYNIFIMGDAKHPEVEGLVGASRDLAEVIPPDPQAIKKIPFHEGKWCLVSQTTQHFDVFEEVASVLKSRCDELIVENTICEPTRSHQMETMDIAKSVDMVVVVGGKHSANTRHLAELAGRLGARVVHVETDGELRPADFKDVKTVGVTAGASTPQWMIRRVVERLKSFDGKTGFFKNIFKMVVEALVPTNIYSTLSFATIYAGLSLYMRFPLEPLSFLSTLAMVFALHCINEFGEESGFDRRSRLSPVAYERFRRFMLVIAMVAFTGSLLATGWAVLERGLGLRIPLILLVAGFGGMIYGWKLVPQKYIRKLGFRSIKDLPGSKDLTVSTGWTLLLTVIPPSSTGVLPGLHYALLILLVFLLIYRRSAIMAVRDVQGDRIVGMESSFRFLGKKRSRRLHRMVDFLILALFLPVLFFFRDESPALQIASVLALLSGQILSYLYRKRILPVGTAGQFLLDSQFVLPGLLFFLYFTIF